MSEADDKKKDEKSDKENTDLFRIRDFPDLRRLRGAYIRKGDRPIELDSSDNPRPENDEQDFGLTRSTPEEAWKFFRETLCEEPAGDELTEFLDDD